MAGGRANWRRARIRPLTTSRCSDLRCTTGLRVRPINASAMPCAWRCAKRRRAFAHVPLMRCYEDIL